MPKTQGVDSEALIEALRDSIWPTMGTRHKAILGLHRIDEQALM